MALTIDELNIKIQSEADGAEKGVDGLTDALSRLKANLDFTAKLAAVASGISAISKSSGDLNKIDYRTFTENMKNLSTALQPMQGFKTQASGLLSSLRGFKLTAEEFNSFTGFGAFRAQVETLASSLEPLNGVSGKLGATLNALSQVTQISNGLSTTDFGTLGVQITSLTNALAPLGNMQSRLGSTLNQLSRLGAISKDLHTTMTGTALGSDINILVSALNRLQGIGKSNLGTVLGQLKKFPEIAQALSGVDMQSFASGVKAMSDALEPLVTQLNAVSTGFSALPQKVRAVANATDTLQRSNERATKSYGGLLTNVTKTIGKFAILSMAFKRVWSAMAGWFTESAEYIENLNLFTVTMGDATDAALDYAEAVQKAMGVDVSAWIRYQGTFQQLVTGFGVASDKAEIMSQNLTQLAYDLSSFFNVDVETAFDKLSSGMSGQIKGLKEFGFNLSVAALQEYALSKGITQKVRTMNEAQKSLLRYNLLMERSVNAQGDMARTLVTPSNALRILTAQLTQMKRALGNIVSVIAVEVIPYVQAFVRIITEASNDLANLLGFELPTIDYSGLSNAFADADEDANGVADSVKEIKKQLMGFDELNILNDPDSSSSGSSSGVGSDWDLPLDSYDFLGSISDATDKIYNQVKTFITDTYDLAKKYMPLIEALLVGAFGYAVVNKFATSTKKATSALKAFKKATLSKSLTTYIATLAGFSASFIGVSGAVKDAVSGAQDWETSVRNIIAVTALAGTAMYALLGPIGLVMVGLGALGGAWHGYEKAAQEVARDKAQKEFFDGLGTSIGTVANEFTKLTQGHIGYTTTILANQSTFDANKKSINDSGTAISNMLAIMKTSSDEIANEYVPQIREAFIELERAVSDNLQLVNENITLALATAPESALQRLGISTERIKEIVSGATSNIASELDSLTAEADRLTDALELDPNNAELNAQLNDIQTQILTLTAEACPALTDFKSALDLSHIDFDSPEKALEGINGIKTAYANAEKAISESTTALLADLETLKAGMTSEEYEYTKNVILAIDAGHKQELLDDYGEFGGAVVKEFERRMQEGIDNWKPTMWQSFKAAVMVSDTVSREDADGFIWAKDNGFGDIYEALGDFKAQLDKEKSALDKTWKELGTTASGFADGITTNLGSAETAGADLGNSALKGTQKAIDSHSPSKEFGKLGLYSVQGFANSVTDNFLLIRSAWDRSFASWFKQIENNFSEEKWSKLAQSAMNGLKKSFKLPTVSDMFIANGTGADLVGRMGARSAVANSDQIVSGIATGVYNAVSAAMQENGGGGNKRIEFHTTVELEKRPIGEAVAEWNNGIVKQTGKSPLLV